MRNSWICLILILLSATALAQTKSNSELLEGSWQKIDEPGKMMIFKGNDLFVSFNQAQFHWKFTSDDKVITLSDVWGWTGEYPYEIKGGELTVPFKFANGSFRRLDTTSPELYTDPLVFGTKEPSEAEIESIRSELIARGEKDQAIRGELNAILTAENKDETEEKRVFDEMKAIDQDNKRWLIETVSTYGWIDTTRFGKEAANAAFLTVQHCQYLPLMRAVLPELKREVEAGTIGGGSYALLFDRTMLNLGIKQRYGTQVRILEGAPTLAPIEDLEKADVYRAELGMELLSEYLKRIEEQFGKPVEFRK